LLQTDYHWFSPGDTPLTMVVINMVIDRFRIIAITPHYATVIGHGWWSAVITDMAGCIAIISGWLKRRQFKTANTEAWLE